MSKWETFDHGYALGVRMPSDSKTKYGAVRYVTVGGFDRDVPEQVIEAGKIASMIADLPEILDALADLFNSEWQDDDGEPRLEDARDRARALIAKHRGGV